MSKIHYLDRLAGIRVGTDKIAQMILTAGLIEEIDSVENALSWVIEIY